jgi:hypothetical protein
VVIAFELRDIDEQRSGGRFSGQRVGSHASTNHAFRRV